MRWCSQIKFFGKASAHPSTSSVLPWCLRSVRNCFIRFTPECNLPESTIFLTPPHAASWHSNGFDVIFPDIGTTFMLGAFHFNVLPKLQWCPPHKATTSDNCKKCPNPFPQDMFCIQDQRFQMDNVTGFFPSNVVRKDASKPSQKLCILT